ncbi:Uncharacterised protein [Actinobaculum suis]|uniref:DUF6318 domain-containing protein n=2 Tax=Actinobaculum suis TaxID=1657 RepID=A0A7Z9C8Q6_9ACTO|nr:Uncharacterised protein [Actinobaculum suis]
MYTGEAATLRGMKPRFVWRPAAWRYAALGLSILFVLPVLVGCGSTDSSSPSPTLTVVPPESLQTSDAANKESVETNNDADSTTAVKEAGEAEKPVPPAAMENVDADGAIAAAEYYLLLTLYGATTLETEDLEKMSGAECAWCQEEIRRLKGWTGYLETMPEFEIYERQGWYDAEQNDFVVALAGKRGSSQLNSPEGTSEARAQEFKVGMILENHSDQWVVTDIYMELPEDGISEDGAEQ